MVPPIEKAANQYDGHVAVVDSQRALAYAAATNDDNPAYRAGTCVPPLYAVVPAWDALMSVGREVVPPEHFPTIVHSEQDMWFHRPLVPGQTVRTRGELWSVRSGLSGTRVTVRLLTGEEDTSPVVEQYVTLLARGMRGAADFGPPRPDHSFPRSARARQVAEVGRQADADQTYRYRDASGDDMPIHVDEEAARAVGLPGIILHGLCTMAMCGSAVVESVAGSDPTRLRRLAVRFARPVLPGSELLIEVYEAGGSDGRAVYAFEASSRGKVVVRDGRAEVEA